MKDFIKQEADKLVLEAIDFYINTLAEDLPFLGDEGWDIEYKMNMLTEIRRDYLEEE